ncbi:MAG: hypothetical protein QM714_05465 [Nocardioides sp.]|uniref:hypothetical protein n=1 Tax=Nocardioides sp. TaxID=35761 RepID=UPI0039E52792
MRQTLHRWLRGDDPANAWVVPVALALLAAQVGYRAWASFGSWWTGDDFLYVIGSVAPGGNSLQHLMTSYAGHLLPADFYVTGLLTRISPYDFTLAAITLTVLQLVANIGFLRLMLVAFGRRWGIVPPLVVFLATSFTVQGSVWWASGIQALPFVISLCWALASQIQYARTRRPAAGLAACAWVLFGLLFYEKALLVIGALAIVTVTYFTTGRARDRIAQTWRDYRLSVVANTLLGLAYLAIYIRYGLNYDPGAVAEVPIGPTADTLLLRSWLTGVFGGPLRWSHTDGAPISFAAPPSPVVLAAGIALVLLLREVARSRERSLRALVLPAYFLICDVLLVAATRATMIGPVIGFELRYLTEMSAVTAAALAFATMPVIGAAEPVKVRRPSALLDRRGPAVVACIVVAALGTLSTSRYIHQWHIDQPAKTFFGNLIADAQRAPAGTPVVDGPVPNTLIWEIARPNNTVSHLLAPIDHGLDFVTWSTDQLNVVALDGRIRPAEVPSESAAPPGDQPACGYPVSSATTVINLDREVVYPGWWVEVGYLATADSAITVTAGGKTQHASVSGGLHHLFFQAGDQPFDAVELGGLIGGATMCVGDVIIGPPRARMAS